VDDSTILDKIGGKVDLDFMETETKSDTTVPRIEMSDEAQRIAIAEACGWKHVQIEEWMRLVSNAVPPYNFFTKVIEIPDYLNDLNAMHEAEKVLTDAQMSAYERELGYLCCKFATKPGPAYKIWHATAAQRAEAFLKTLGLWKP
jgi:hypothetical protein